MTQEIISIEIREIIDGRFSYRAVWRSWSTPYKTRREAIMAAAQEILDNA